jgi:WD40 repeat protein
MEMAKFRWVFLLITGIALLAGCNSSSAHRVTSSTTSSPKPNPTSPITGGSPLPTFSDWRVAYMGLDGTIHVITLDGKTDISGPDIPFAPSNQASITGSGINNAGFAPDGHTLAFADPLLNIIDVAKGNQVDIPASPLSAPNSAAWSPDGTMLALAGGNYEFDIAKASDGTITTIPHTPFPGNPPEANILNGWLDATHIAVSGFLPSVVGQSTATYVLYSLDITTGVSHPIAQMTMPAQEEEGLLLSPDGTKALFYTIPFQGHAYTPYVAEIDVGSGAITSLPALAQMETSSSFITNVAWQRGTQTVALSTGYIVNNNLKNWLVNLQQDSASQLQINSYPLQWSPDNKTLIMSSQEQNASAIGAGPFTLTALAFGANGQTTQTVLTTQAYNFNFIGFIRTASSG